MLLRIVLIVLVVGLVLWLLGARSRRRASPTVRPPEAFARCAHCGVHLPLDDAVVDGGLAYCSEAHRLAGPGERGS